MVSYELATQSWDNTFLDHVASTDYIDLMMDNHALYQWMKQLDQDGLILVKIMPSTQTALTDNDSVV